MIEGLSCDSRTVKKNFLFAALPGKKTDGELYIEEAIKRGAIAVLQNKHSSENHSGQDSSNKKICRLYTENPRKAFSFLAAQFYQYQPNDIAAVTGTNGKTSVADFYRQIVTYHGYKAASIGTIGMYIGSQKSLGSGISSLTTPDPVSLYQNLAALHEAGVTHLCLEASSHGLHQYRLDAIATNVAGFTNITHDHLDYHGNFTNYFNAKMRLFDEVLPKGSKVVLNADSPYYEKIRSLCKKRKHAIFSYGRKGRALQLHATRIEGSKQYIDCTIFDKKYQLQTEIMGEFQIENILCALGLVMVQTNMPGTKIIEAVPHLRSVLGRMERISDGKTEKHIFVDYAHTPDALEKVLKALRRCTKEKLWVVFGCGGERDHEKRPSMGKIAAEYADKVIITDDNPRHEDAASIRKEIILGCPEAYDIPDRKKAIAFAIEGMAKKDVLLVAGKGHENFQYIGERLIPFSDQKVIRNILQHIAE